MRDKLLALHELQQIDLRALELEKLAEQIPNRIAEHESVLDEQRAELGVLNTEADAQRAEQRTAEGQIREDTHKAQKWKRRLNDIKTPREYQALSRETEQLERNIRDAEDRVMGLMEELEAKDKVIADKQGVLREAEAEVNKKVRKLKSQQSKLKGEAADISKGRIDVIGKLPPNVVKQYEKIRKRRHGVAVAYVQGKGTCGACHVDLRPQHVVEIRRLNTIETCASCSRLLVLGTLVNGDEQD